MDRQERQRRRQVNGNRKTGKECPAGDEGGKDGGHKHSNFSRKKRE